MRMKTLRVTECLPKITSVMFYSVRGLEEIGDDHVVAIAVEPAEEEAVGAGMEDLVVIEEGQKN
jgi:hypothetical protein